MKNKVAIVTGGSSGIGRHTAIALRNMGCTVYELSRRNIPIENVIHIKTDITDEQAVFSAIKQIVDTENAIDIVVNCAGFGISGAVEFTKTSDAKTQFDVNFFGMININRAVIPIMRRKGQGHIVNISSVAAVAHIPFQAFYSATKAATDSYSCALDNELKAFGIRVTSVQPGDICTDFTQARKKSFAGDDIYNGRISRSVESMEKDEQNGMSPELAGKYIAKIALKKHTKPIYTIGYIYKILSVLCKVLPCRIRNFVIGLLYAK